MDPSELRLIAHVNFPSKIPCSLFHQYLDKLIPKDSIRDVFDKHILMCLCKAVVRELITYITECIRPVITEWLIKQPRIYQSVDGDQCFFGIDEGYVQVNMRSILEWCFCHFMKTRWSKCESFNYFNQLVAKQVAARVNYYIARKMNSNTRHLGGMSYDCDCIDYETLNEMIRLAGKTMECIGRYFCNCTPQPEEKSSTASLQDIQYRKALYRVIKQGDNETIYSTSEAALMVIMSEGIYMYNEDEDGEIWSESYYQETTFVYQIENNNDVIVDVEQNDNAASVELEGDGHMENEESEENDQVDEEDNGDEEDYEDDENEDNEDIEDFDDEGIADMNGILQFWLDLQDADVLQLLPHQEDHEEEEEDILLHLAENEIAGMNGFFQYGDDLEAEFLLHPAGIPGPEVDFHRPLLPLEDQLYPEAHFQHVLFFPPDDQPHSGTDFRHPLLPPFMDPLHPGADLHQPFLLSVPSTDQLHLETQPHQPHVLSPRFSQNRLHPEGTLHHISLCPPQEGEEEEDNSENSELSDEITDSGEGDSNRQLLSDDAEFSFHSDDASSSELAEMSDEQVGKYRLVISVVTALLMYTLKMVQVSMCQVDFNRIVHTLSDKALSKIKLRDVTVNLKKVKKVKIYKVLYQELVQTFQSASMLLKELQRGHPVIVEALRRHLTVPRKRKNKVKKFFLTVTKTKR